MAHYTGPRAKISRRFNAPVLGCEKVLEKKPYPAGQHGRKRKRQSDYALQLLAKQQAKYYYGLREVQFRNVVRRAISKKGAADSLLAQLLERRLDVVVHRLGIAPTIAAARQLVVHRHIRVNTSVMDRPSYLLNPGDSITMADEAKLFALVKNSLANRKACAWLAWDSRSMRGELLDISSLTTMPEEMNGKRIIEYYSR